MLEVKKTEWDLSPLFKGDDDSEMDKKRKEVEEKSYAFINKWKNRSDYLEKPEVLKEALDEYEKLQRDYGCDGGEGYYFHLRSTQDQSDSKIKAKETKITEFGNKIMNDIQFFTLNIAKITEKEQKNFLEYQRLADYRHFLEKIFKQAKYNLSEQEEKILRLKDESSREKWVKMVSGFLAKEEREVLNEEGKRDLANFSKISSLLDSKKKDIRDSAAFAFNDILKKNIDAAEAEINSVLLDKKINDGIYLMILIAML